MRRLRRVAFGGLRARRILRPLGPPALRRLRQAHARREAGDFLAAGREYHELGVLGESQGIPRSVQAFLLAGECYLKAGARDEGLADLRHAVEAARTFGQSDRLVAAATRIADELRRSGHAAEAQAFLDMLGPGRAAPAGPTPIAGSVPPRLPPKCPACGGNVLPGEVEWADAYSVLCDYCGSVIQREAD